MVKNLLLFLLLLSGPVSFAQSPETDALELKNRRRDLWYADSSFHQLPSELSGEQATGTKQKRAADTQLLKKITSALGYLTGALILAALGYAFYSFSKNNTPKNTLPKNNLPSEPTLETVEDLYGIDFISHIKAAEDHHDFRLALRYHYLRLLQEFSRQSLIRYEKGKTNKQYAEEIKNHKWGPDFLLATRYYNFVWYGGHAIDRDNYHQLAGHFKKILPYE